VWPRTRNVSSHLRVDLRSGSFPSGAGTNDWRTGSLAMRETFIATRETIVPARETIVAECETSLAGGVGVDDCGHTHVPMRRCIVGTGAGSDVCEQTQRGQRDPFDPVGRGRAGRHTLFDPRRVATVPARRLLDPGRVAIDPRRPGTVRRPQFFARRASSFAPSPCSTVPTGHTQEVRCAGNAARHASIVR
jgi:hypothetical protein